MKEKPDKYGVLRPRGKRFLDIRVGPDSFKRALRIMDALIKALEARGFPVSIESPENQGPGRTRVEINGEFIDLSLNEKTRLLSSAPTEKEKRFIEKYPCDWWRYKSIPIGKLTLCIGCLVEGKQKRWSDTASGRLEEKLDDFVKGAIDLTPLVKQERLESEESMQRFEEAVRLKKESLIDQKRLDDLENQAQLWAKSKQLRAYIRNVEKIVSNRTLSEELQERFKKWLSWAMQHADRLDPLSDGLPFIKDPEPVEVRPDLKFYDELFNELDHTSGLK